MTSTVACPACRDAVAIDAVTRASRRARCGCGARFDLLPPRPEGEAFGPYRGEGQEARLTPPPIDEEIVDLSGRRRTRYVRVHRRAIERGERIARGLAGAVLFGLAFAILAWAVAHSVGSSIHGVVFLTVFAVMTVGFAALVLVGKPSRPREIWIEEGAIYWGQGRSRPLAEIEGVCHAVSTHRYLAFPLPSGKAERFMQLDDLTDEAREWLVQHLNDGIALARSERS
jgi:hypothetical protein